MTRRTVAGRTFYVALALGMAFTTTMAILSACAPTTAAQAECATFPTIVTAWNALPATQAVQWEANGGITAYAATYDQCTPVVAP